MAIIFHESDRTFHLYNDSISYCIAVTKYGHLAGLYFGKKLRDRDGLSHLIEYSGGNQSPGLYEDGVEDPSYSLNEIRQEYPSFGHGDLRQGALVIGQKNGSRITDFRYVSHRIYDGKPRLAGLPAVYTEEDSEAQTLEITLRDELIRTDLILLYSIYNDYPAIARSARIECHNPEGITVLQAASACLDLPDSGYEMLELAGGWARECHMYRNPLRPGIQSVYSRRGNSSSQFNPFLALLRPDTTETRGEALGFSLLYSGNYLAQTDVDYRDVTRVTIGIHPDGFAWPLEEGQYFQTPEAVLVYSDEGLSGMSRAYHRLYSRRLVRGYWRDHERPILLNNWEATYFGITEEKMLNIASKARDLGVDLFVMDDGWFGTRNHDHAGLGDWYVNRDKLPQGVRGLAEKVTALGMKFGLWFEPEMVNEDSELYRAHPDWVLRTPGRSASKTRHQWVLDFSRDDVMENLYQQMSAILRDAPISYVKWDMNRSMSEVYSAAYPPEQQGTVYHRYILNVYALYERLRTEFPHILFESCAGGGARFDAGMLYYAPQGWTSDDTDAMERVSIQYGASVVYPLSSLGAHVSASPNHQLSRVTSIATRAATAYFGTFGYELDPNQLSPEDQAEIREQIRFIKQYRRIIHQGDLYRLENPYENNGEAAWICVSPDRSQAVAAYFRFRQHITAPLSRIRLAGLDPDADYKVSYCRNSTEPVELPFGPVGGDELMQYGLITSDSRSGIHNGIYPDREGDYLARIYLLEKL